MRLGLTLQERWYALSRPQQVLIGGGAIGLLLLVVFRKPVGRVVSAAISDAERAILKAIAAGGQESYIDAAFAVGAREGISPYYLLGTLYIESGFGRYLTKGSAFGQTVYTGDFIPRPVMTTTKDGKTVPTNATKMMEKFVLPGVKRTYWERPQVGNLVAYKGEMWVPAHDLRVAAAGGNLQAAYAKNTGVAGGVGWGFTPWQLDWASFAPALVAGAAWEPEKATAEAVKLIKNNIAILKKAGLSGPKLVQGVIASYNAGTKPVLAAFEAGTDLTTVTAHKDYVSRVMSVADKVGKTITIA